MVINDIQQILSTVNNDMNSETVFDEIKLIKTKDTPMIHTPIAPTFAMTKIIGDDITVYFIIL